MSTRTSFSSPFPSVLWRMFGAPFDDVNAFIERTFHMRFDDNFIVFNKLRDRTGHSYESYAYRVDLYLLVYGQSPAFVPLPKLKVNWDALADKVDGRCIHEPIVSYEGEDTKKIASKGIPVEPLFADIPESYGIDYPSQSQLTTDFMDACKLAFSCPEKIVGVDWGCGDSQSVIVIRGPE